jgi:hypothetical protein
MAFTGVPVIQQINDSLYRVTGVSLGIGASGTIGPPGSGAEVILTRANWGAGYRGGQEPLIDLGESMQVLINPVGAGAATAVPVRVVKTTPAVGLVTLTNNDGAAVTSDLEIYVRNH